MLFIQAVLLVLAVAVVEALKSTQPHAWWKEAVVYQVYPASFKESRVKDAIGWGDINGIIEGLDHIEDLGTDILWLSPFYDSPLLDMGYDISNYDSVNRKFGGKLDDIKRLIKEVHKRGMKIIFDLVINHTSNEHPWFKQSELSTTNPYRDWYFWRPPQHINGSRYPPNNWAGNNDGSAWKYEPRTGEYYLNLFNPFQPDLNWRNSETRQAIHQSALEFWLDMGIDGFRMDSFSIFSKWKGLPDVPADDDDFYSGKRFYNNGPQEHQYLHEMNQKFFAPHKSFTVGEYGYISHPDNPQNMEKIQKYVSAARHEVNTVLVTDMVDIGRDGFTPLPWTLQGWRKAINFTQAVGSTAVGDGWNSVYLESHDLPRSISRFGNDSPLWRVRSGKALAMLLSTLSGTLFVYEGQEIGMVNVPQSWNISDFRDYRSKQYYNDAKKAGENLTLAVYNLTQLARDNARVPFNWNSQGGFSVVPDSDTWTPVVHKDINLVDQRNQPGSVYTFWTEMLRLRKKYKNLFVYGQFEFLDWKSHRFLVYEKTSATDKAVVILNLSEHPAEPLQPPPRNAKVIAHTHNEYSGLKFQGFEGRVYLM